MDLNWIIKSRISKGRDYVLNDPKKYNTLYLFLVLFVAICQLTVFSLFNLSKFIFLKNYYIENWKYETLTKPIKRFSIVYYGIKEITSLFNNIIKF